MDTLASIAEVIGLVLVLVLVLIATYYTTRFIAKQTGGQLRSKNINVIETYKIAPNKYIQIIKVAGHFLVIAVTKDHVEMLTEVSEEEVELITREDNTQLSFLDVFKNITKNK